MLGRQRAGVDAVGERLRRRDRAKQLLEPRGVRREAAVEADREQRALAPRRRRASSRASLTVIVIGFSTKTCLARLERRARDGVVQVVTRGDVDDVDRGVGDAARGSRSRPSRSRRSRPRARTVSPLRAQAAASGSPRGPSSSGSSIEREVAAVADDADAERAGLGGRAPPPARAIAERARRRRGRPGGSRAGSPIGRLVRRERRVGRRARSRRRSGASISGATRSVARRDLAQHLLEVAALGPAHVAERVVLALLLVRRVVAAGPVRASRSGSRSPSCRSCRAGSGSARRRRARRGPCAGSLERLVEQARVAAAAVTITASAPWPSVRSTTPAAKSRRPVKPASQPERARRATARSAGRRLRSPTAPAAFSICTVIWPSRPRPSTATRSPRPGSAWRTPWSAIAPSVAKAASSNDTPSGIARHEVARHRR